MSIYMDLLPDCLYTRAQIIELKKLIVRLQVKVNTYEKEKKENDKANLYHK